MGKRIDIPFDWHKYSEHPAYFVTYFGEIFFGTIWELFEYPDRFFIVQNDKIKEIKSLKQEDRTLEKYQQLGREILDVKVIKGVYDDLGIDTTINDNSYRGDQKFKRMFVFGAAASAFCSFGDGLKNLRQSNLCPPTGFEIFDEKYSAIIEQFSGAKLSIPLFESLQKNIEACLEAEWQNFKSYFNPHVAVKHINIQFYLQLLMQLASKEVVENHYRTNLYALFLNKIQAYIAKNTDERISMVSFNYDTILDQFITQTFRYTFDTMSDYIDWNNRNIVLYKPHGSCNWGWKFQDNNYSNLDAISLAHKLYGESIEPSTIYYEKLGAIDEMVAKNSWGYEYFNDQHHRGRYTLNKNKIKLIKEDEKGHFPAILIPYRDKDEMLMPYEHFNGLQHAIGAAEGLFLIGWKGNEHLFNEQFKKHSHNKLKQVVIVNPDAATVKLHLAPYIDLKKVEVIEIHDFETFVLHHLDQLLIKN